MLKHPKSRDDRVLRRIIFAFFLVSLFILIENVNTTRAVFIPEKLMSNLTSNSQRVKDVKIGGRDSSEESSEESEDPIDFWKRIGKMRFIQGFLAALSLIIGMELGDKTFFIAAIMSMRHSRWTIFMAAISALVLMTLLSVFLGLITNLIPRTLTHYVSICLFLGFGLKMIRDGYIMTEEEAKEEYEEVNKKIAKRESIKTEDTEFNLVSSSSGQQTTEDIETGVLKTIQTVPFTTRLKRKLMNYISLIFIETFLMTFVAEWGDRSQIATIALAANHDMVAVTLGAIIGHSICTGLAVIGGRFIAQMISVRTVTIIGGIIFIFFAFLALVIGTHDEQSSAVSL
ncbi:transmembrane protein 165-like protein [Dinothrombium tinctorium]|uniref:GDT1 family protein n=1 Tax=Dinothrombium tinctorium TaxID=1965070 RepID=A0A443QEM8_9ACAR|nr:transmembrane protein 165-like protein [Dinothrombium tinctorium]RWS01493.1 transmembrane protein 165-like protein [Dinothrombium tinctorium]RWS10677.1 transmembrane protein 165-like protein [Dinothrombium tinctorium]